MNGSGQAWKVLGESLAGTSHVAAGLPCQDCWSALELRLAAECYLILSCADGAGSATHAQRGSEVCCTAFIDIVADQLEQGAKLSDFGRNRVLEIGRRVVRALEREAEIAKVPLRELSCTLLGAVIGETSALFAQVGDGAIVVRTQEGYRPVFWPQSGEYASTTYFVTGGDLERMLQCELIEERVEEVALFTDGLERLLLHFATRTAHRPFFEPTFRTLRNAESVDSLRAHFHSFLDSPAVNSRTDDDKTLLLALRHEASP
ncbi:MAG: PP2C family serine/threonine-protein phosphatase [Planctomycetota bacterium]